MRCPKLINRTATKLYNLCGYNTKKQNSEIAINIGKELLDLSKTQLLTEELLTSVIEKHYPNAKINVIIGEDKFRKHLEKLRFPKAIIDGEVQCGGVFMQNRPPVKGGTIYLKKDADTENTNLIKIFSHEFNHFLDYNATLRYTKIKLEHLWKKSFIGKFFRKKSRKKSDITEPKSITIQRNLIDMFGCKEMSKKKQFFIQDTSNNPAEILKFYSGNKYTGLNSPKRIDAFIRAILRHSANPKNKNALKELKRIKIGLSDELRAYRTSENVERYITNNYKEISIQNLTVDIIERALKLIDKEIKIARKEVFLRLIGLRPKKTYNTTLPSASYIAV